MSEFPKWIKCHESHDVNLVAKTHDIHRDRATGNLTVLVDTPDDEAVLVAPFEAPKEDHKEEV